MELGNYENYWTPEIAGSQNLPEITWDCFAAKNGFDAYRRPNTTIIYYDTIDDQRSSPMTNLNFVKSRFDKATAEQSNPWNYGTMLLLEEVMTPIMRDNWGFEPKSSWDQSDISMTLAGITLKSWKRYLIDKYGSFDPNNTSWSQEWSDWYSLNLYTAWNNHMHNLGKKSAIIGFTGTDVTDMQNYVFNYAYPGGSGSYIVNNFDLIFQYSYPERKDCTAIDCTSTSEYMASQLRGLVTNKLGWLLTAQWATSGRYSTPWSEPVSQDEFNKIAPYADVAFIKGHVNYIWGGATPIFGAPYLVKFYNDLYGGCPPVNISIGINL